MSVVRIVGVAVLLILAAIGGASLFGYDVSIQPDSDRISTSTESDTVVTDSTVDEPTTESEADADTPSASFDQNNVRSLFYERLNKFRDEHGRATLSADTLVVQAAEGHSEDMATRDYFSHESPEGATPHDRLRETGAQCSKSGKNIAQTWWRESLTSSEGPTYIDSDADLATALFIQWRESSGHREVMLIRGINDIGLGLAQTAEGKVYATMNIC
jgi:uncharacterized protein YkwD